MVSLIFALYKNEKIHYKTSYQDRPASVKKQHLEQLKMKQYLLSVILLLMLATWAQGEKISYCINFTHPFNYCMISKSRCYRSEERRKESGCQ